MIIEEKIITEDISSKYLLGDVSKTLTTKGLIATSDIGLKLL